MTRTLRCQHYFFLFCFFCIFKRGTKTIPGNHWLNNSCSQFLPGFGTFPTMYQLNSLGSIQRCCHHDAGNCSNTDKRSLSNQISIYSCIETVLIQVKCLAHRDSATLRQARPVPEISRSKVAGRNHRATASCMYTEYTFMQI